MNKKKFALMLASVALIASTVLFGTLAYFTDKESVANTFTVGNIDITLDEAKVNDYGEPLKGTDVVKDYIDENGKINNEDADGNPITPPKVDRHAAGNNYKMVPGRTYVKDPTMTVAAGSEPAYVRMIVYITGGDVVTNVFDALKAANDPIDEPIKIFNDLDTEHWIMQPSSTSITSPGSLVYEFRYVDDKGNAVVDASKETSSIVLPELFDSFTLPGLISGNAVKALTDANMEIIIEGQAIQADSFVADGTKSAEEVAWDAFKSQTAFDNAYPGTTQP